MTSTTKTIRDTEAYKNMDSYYAVGYAEGFEEAESEEQVLAAWQYIKDKGLWKSLQGFFGRTVSQLTDEGVLID